MNGQGEPAERVLPERIGPYCIVAQLGRGGMGIVYEGVRPGSAKRVAVKTIRTNDRRLTVALRAEAKALQEIEHPSVVSIIEAGLFDQPPWYAMELIEGRSLAGFNQEIWGPFGGLETPRGSHDSENLAARPLDYETPSHPTLGSGATERPAPEIPSPQGRPTAAGKLVEVLRIYRRLCAPLAHIHARGLVHGDLKPNNILLRLDGVPIITDFGLTSRVVGAAGRDTISDGFRRLLGTAPYVAPEQIRGEFLDSRSDLYSLGCMLYESLTGRPPFLGAHILSQHEHEPPPPLSTFVEGVPGALEELVQSLLAKRTPDRMGHVHDLEPVLDELTGDGAGQVSTGRRSAVLPYLYRPDLVGRTEILDQLYRACDGAERGRGSLIAINGDSGIGKTFLGAAVGRYATLRGFQVVTGQTLNVNPEGADPDIYRGSLHLFSRLFQYLLDRCWEGNAEGRLETSERLLGPRGKVLAAYLPALANVPGHEPHPEPPHLPPEAARQRLFAALAETLGHLASDAPLLLILDDLQWADELSLEFLASLPADLLAEHRLLLICLYRTEALSPPLGRLGARPDALSIMLPALDYGGISSMVASMLALPQAPRALVDFAWRHSEGNPFFSAEYLRSAAAMGVLERRDRRWRLVERDEQPGVLEALDRPDQLPTSIAGLVHHRLDLCRDSARELTEMAAVLGREFDTGELAEMVGRDEEELDSELRELIANQIVEPIGPRRYRFGHDKLREVAYAALTAERRQELHRASAHVLERRLGDTVDGATVLAYHFKNAGERPKATQYLERAAAHALSRFANHEAQRYFEELLRWGVAGDGPAGEQRRAGWERSLGDALHARGEHESSRVHLDSAAARLGYARPVKPLRLARSVAGQLARQVGNRLFAARAASYDPAERSRCLVASQAYDRLLQIFYYQGQAPQMFHATLMTLNLAERAGPSPELARAFSIAHAVAGVMPVRPLAELYLTLAKGILAQAYDSEVDSYLQLLAGVYRSGTAEWERAEEAFEKGLALAGELAFERRGDELHLGLSTLAFLQGRYAGALRHVDVQASRVGRGDAQAQAWQLLMRGQISLAQTATEDALERARQAERLAERGKLERSELIWLYALSASANLETGARTEARNYAELALEQILSGQPVTFYCIDSYYRTGQIFFDLHEAGDATRSSAEKAHKAMRAFARVFPAALPRAQLLDARLALLAGDAERARRSWRQSAESATRLRMPVDRIAAQLALGRALPPSDERERLLAEALAAAKSLEAWALAEQAGAALTAQARSMAH